MGVPATSGQLRTSLFDMQIGDYIACRYTATTSGAVGTFRELGTCIASEIPVTGSATPDGLFYFIKVDKGLLIADRVVQHSISWNTLNNGDFIKGKLWLFNTAKASLPAGTTLVSGTSVIAVTDGIIRHSSNNFYVDNQNLFFSSGETAVILEMVEEVIINQLFVNPAVGYSSAVGEFNMLKDFELYVSNDKINWTLIFSGSCPSSPLGGPFIYSITSQIPYKYYKLKGLSTYYSGIGLGEVAINPHYISYRSLSSGCAYADANGNSATTDQGYGGWPTNNEWDKYIVNSNLGGKIIPGDNNVWHWSNLYTWVQDTPITTIGASSNRIYRGKDSVNKLLQIASSTANTTIGFRPVLEYLELGSKATTMWY
ncbi:hypothetical protein E308F_30660 [Moorella sp. E308F]|uniref:hypothetical protein n=1 Tax=Moorella sp. E308F TaxID=2572682 RepID=UPI0010FFBD48|nr:hypothetical protein [Moorella sp. E308F]GEA16820.1 hypothetical protein E308F_30660 [Moorella sp. E308F]